MVTVGHKVMAGDGGSGSNGLKTQFHFSYRRVGTGQNEAVGENGTQPHSLDPYRAC